MQASLFEPIAPPDGPAARYALFNHKARRWCPRQETEFTPNAVAIANQFLEKYGLEWRSFETRKTYTVKR